MLDILIARISQGHQTMTYPDGPSPPLPPRFRGLPVLDADKCADGCTLCADVCPTQAITPATAENAAAMPGPLMDLGRCLFCTQCTSICPADAIHFTQNHRLAARRAQHLHISPHQSLPPLEELSGRLKKLLGRSLKIRVVSAGGCNACEADVNVLGTIGWDLQRFGIDFVASPRHADALLLTGALSRNMHMAVRKTWDAMPDPKIAIAVGACAISGGPYAGHPEVLNGAESVLPVDLFIPGCPPHPLTILDGLLRVLGKRIADGQKC